MLSVNGFRTISNGAAIHLRFPSILFQRTLTQQLRSARPPPYSSNFCTAHPFSTLFFALQKRTAATITRFVHNRACDHKPCEVCFPKASPAQVQLAKCKGISEKEEERIWITAHNGEQCCGHQHRTLVLCFDGTGEEFDEDVSSVQYSTACEIQKNMTRLWYRARMSSDSALC